MSKKQPTPPPPPDYAAANEAAINADLATLPQRRLIEAQARLGQGQFAGLGDADLANQLFQQDLANAPQAAQGLLDIQQRFGPAFAQQARESLQATDPTGFALRDQLGGRLGGGTNTLEGLYASAPTFDPQAYLNRYPDLRQAVQGMSLDEQNRWATAHWQQFGQAEGREGLTTTPGQVAPSYEQYAGSGPDLARLGGGPAFQSLGDAREAETIGLDSLPGFAGLNNAAAGDRVNLANLPATQTLGDAATMQRFNATPALSGVGGTRLSDTGATAAGRSDLERQIFDELSRAGSPDVALQRSAEQAARARGAARGNILGDSSALQESLGVQLAQRQLDAQRRNDALGLLQSGQGVSDTNNRLQLAQQQSDIAGAGFNNTAAQQQYSNLRSNAEFNNQAAQQDFANQATRAGFNNTANNQALQQLMAAIGLNNATGTQDLANQQAVAGFNNANAQQGFQNRAAASGFNNQASQQDFNNRSQSAGFNNANAQQGFQNRAAVVGQGNDAANQAFQNAMSAINQRNQSRQNTFGAQQGLLAQRAGGRQQDLANIQSFLGLQPIVSQGAQLSGLQQGAAPFVQNSYNGTNINPNAGQQGAAFAGNIFGTQAGIYGQQLQNSGSPLGSILGAFGGAIGGPLGGAIGSGIGGLFGGKSAGSQIGAGIAGICHIAREVYGETNPKWVLFFEWKEFRAPAWFRWLYNKFSKPVAALIRPFPAVKNFIRRWMDTKIRGL